MVLVTALAPLAWGTTYVVTTELLPAGRPLLAGVLRALPAGLALAAVTRRRPVGAWWAKAAVLGTLNIGAFFALLFVAAYRLPGGVAATLGAIQPLVAAALAAGLLRERLRPHVAVAGVLGVVGVALLVLRAGAHLDGLGVLAGLAGATAMAGGVVLTKRWGRPVPLLTFTAWQLVAGGLVLLPVAVAAEGPPPPSLLPTPSATCGWPQRGPGWPTASGSGASSGCPWPGCLCSACSAPSWPRSRGGWSSTSTSRRSSSAVPPWSSVPSGWASRPGPHGTSS